MQLSSICCLHCLCSFSRVYFSLLTQRLIVQKRLQLNVNTAAGQGPRKEDQITQANQRKQINKSKKKAFNRHSDLEDVGWSRAGSAHPLLESPVNICVGCFWTVQLGTPTQRGQRPGNRTQNLLLGGQSVATHAADKRFNKCALNEWGNRGSVVYF